MELIRGMGPRARGFAPAAALVLLATVLLGTLPAAAPVPSGHPSDGQAALRHLLLDPGIVAPARRPAAPAGALSVTIGASSLRTDLELPVIFSSKVSGTGPFLYVWNFGDNTTSSVADPSHDFFSSGTHVVVLHVFGPGGTNGSAECNISVAFPVYVQPPVAPPSGTAGRAVEFTIGAGGGYPRYSFFWEFGDGMGSHEQIVNHTYARAGTYDVTVWVNDSVGGESEYSELVLIAYNGSPPGGSGGGSGAWWTGPLLWVVTGVAVVAVAAIVVLVRYRSRG